MRKVKGSRVVLAVLAVAAIGGVGSIAWAAVGGGGVISGCLSPSGYIRGIDDATGSCRSGDTALSWYTKEGADTTFAAKSELGIPGLEYKSVSIPGIVPTGQVSRILPCSTGKSILAGGHSTGVLTITTSQPLHSSGGNAWEFQIRNDSSSTGNFFGWAFCANA